MSGLEAKVVQLGELRTRVERLERPARGKPSG